MKTVNEFCDIEQLTEQFIIQFGLESHRDLKKVGEFQVSGATRTIQVFLEHFVVLITSWKCFSDSLRHCLFHNSGLLCVLVRTVERNILPVGIGLIVVEISSIVKEFELKKAPSR